MNQTVTYDIYSIYPMTLGCGLSQSGSTVTVNLSASGYEDVFPAIQPGDALLLSASSVPAYDGRWVIDTVDVPSMTLTFTHASTGLAPAVSAIQVAVAVVSTYQQPGFTPGTGVTIAGNTSSGSPSVFNGACTVRYVLPMASGVTFTTEFAINFPLGTTVVPIGLSGTITGVANVGSNPPVIVSFAATPSSIANGATSTLAWTTTNADSCLLAAGLGSPVVVGANGSMAETPGATTVYTLTAINSSAQVSASATVTVTDGVTATLTATPQTIAPGAASTLNWTTTNAVSASISPTLGTVALSGSSSVSPATTTVYTITATGSTGATTTASVTVVVSGTGGGGPALTAIPVVHFLACTWNANNAAYVGDLLGQYPPVNMIASTRSFALETLDLNGATGTTFSDNAGACFVAQDDSGHLYWGLQSYSEADFHFTKSKIVPPGRLSPLDRTNWTATATHDNGAGYTPDKVLDGNQASYWWSGQNIPQTLTIDMGASYSVDFFGFTPGNAHTGDNPTSVTIAADGVTIGTFTLSSNPIESLAAVHTMGRVWAFQFTATPNSGWVEMAEVNGYLGSGTPVPTFTRIASGDLLGVGAPTGNTYGGWLRFDSSVFYRASHNNTLYKVNATNFSTISTAAAGGGISHHLMGTVDTGQIWAYDNLSNIWLLAGAESDISLTGVAVSGGNAVYSYSAVTGPALLVGMPVTVTLFPTSGNNVTATITALGTGTFTVAKTTQTNETAAASGAVPFGSKITTLSPASFSITGGIAQAFLDTYNSGKAWLVIDNSPTTTLYHVDLTAVSVVASGPLPVYQNWKLSEDPTQSTRLYGIHNASDAKLYLIDTSSFAVTSVPTPFSNFVGNLIPDPAETPTGIGYQKNTAITFVQGVQAKGTTTAVYPGSVTSGNLLVVSYASETSVDPLTVTDTLGTTYSKAYASAGQPMNIAVYYGVATGSGANTVTISASSGLIQIAEFTGANAVNDVTPYFNSQSVGYSTDINFSAHVTTVSDWDLLVVIGADNANLDAGFTTPTPFSFPLWSGTFSGAPLGTLGWFAAGKKGTYTLNISSLQGVGFPHKAAVAMLALTPNSPTIVTVGGGVYYPVYTITNLTNGARNPDFLVDDEFRIDVTGAPANASLDINVNGTWTLSFGLTDGSGNYTYTSSFQARPHPGDYYQLHVQNFNCVRVKGFLSNTLTYTVSESGTPIPLSGVVFTMTNLTDPGRYPMFVFTDGYRLTLSNAPINSTVNINVNGGWTAGFGTTDGTGNWTYDGVFNDGIIDIQYMTQNPYNFVYFSVNGELSTVVFYRVQFSLDGLVWIQQAHTNFAGLWYGIDPLSGRTVQTMGKEVGTGVGDGSLNANVGLVYSIAGAFPQVAPEGLLSPAVVTFSTGIGGTGSSGGITPVGGDSTQAILLMPAYNGGDRRAQKMFGDLFVEAAVAPGSLIILSLWQKQYESVVATYSPATLVPLNGGLRSPYIVNLSNEGLYSTDIEAIVSWPVGPKTSLITWQPSTIEQPESIQSRPSDWDSAGTPGNKFIQGLMLEFDSFGIAKTFGVQRSDDGGVYVPVECPATALGQRTESFTFVPPFLAHDMRIVSGDGVDWRTYSVKWIFQPYPEQSVNWQTEMVSFGTGWNSILFINLPHISTSDITLTLIFDQGPVASIVVTVPNSGGQFIKTKVTIGYNKFKLVSLRVFSAQKCTVFEKDVEVWVKAWGSEGPFSPVKPFGGPSNPGAEV